MGVLGQKPPEASDISKNQIKWKPDIYFLKRKLFFFLFFLKAYIVKLERNCIDIWGSGGASDISKNQIKWKPDIYFFTFWQCSLNPQKYVLAPQLP